MEVLINDYPKTILGNKEEHIQALKSYIELKALTLNINKYSINLYNMRDSHYDGTNAFNDKAFFYLNTSPSEEAPSEREITIGGETRALRLLCPSPILQNHVTDDNDIVIASFDNSLSNVFVYIDVADDELWLMEIVSRTLTAFANMPNPHSWSTGDKEKLKTSISRGIVEESERQLTDLKRKEKQASDEVEEYTRAITRNYRNVLSYRKQIEALESSPTSLMDMIIKDIETLLAHPKIEDVEFKDGNFILHTAELTLYDEKNIDYWLGKMTIHISMQYSNIRFYSKEGGRKGYWTANDPHPHVNGGDGRACLGNVADTIAELCAQNQLYALVLIAIDFLESVNTSDPAGKKVVNWETVAQRTARLNGEPIPSNDANPDFYDEDDGDGLHICDTCDDHFEDDDLYIVYESAEAGATSVNELSNSSYVCEDCQERHYEYFEEVEGYLPRGEYEVCAISGGVYQSDDMVSAYHINDEGGIDWSSEKRVSDNRVGDQYTYWDSLDEFIHNDYNEEDYLENDDEEDEE